MTNAEKYLKNNVDVEELWKNFSIYYYANKSHLSDVSKSLREFMKQGATPTLTEDERAFLSLLPFTFEKIGKDKLGCLYITYHKGETRYQYSLMPFNHLFQFIKKRRRILNK